MVLKMARWLPFNVKSESSSAHLYGRSTANQRIEALWSIVKPSVITDWSEFFTSLVASTTISEGDEVHSAVLRFCFMDLIRHTLVEFKTYWNTHNVVKSSSSPGGIPDLLFYSTNSLMMKPADPSIHNAQNVYKCPTVTGSEDMDGYLTYLVAHEGLTMPKTKEQAVLLFETLCHLVKTL